VLAPLLASCMASARSVGRDEKVAPGQPTGVVIGKVGFPSRTGDPILGGRLEVVDEGGKRWKVSLDQGLVEDKGQSVPFFAVLQAGKYQMGKLELDYTDTTWTMQDMGLLLEVVPGRVACAGAVYFRARTIIDDPTGGASSYGTGSEIKDECTHLQTLLRQRAPFLAEPPQVALARPRPAGP
jgi:hypothetical protein